MTITIIIISVILLIFVIFGVYRHQCLLRDRAQLMRDAIRNRDFSFRLPTKKLLFGERALQETLNEMGHDIQTLVAHNEVESWQRLTRVLTHEIMNATTPIQSISQAYLSNPDIIGSRYEEGIRAIYDTSNGLATFVDSYRKFTQLQEPILTEINLNNFCNRIAVLYPDIKWCIDVPETITLNADENLLRQVFINLIKNAIEANAKNICIKHVFDANQSKEKNTFSKLQISNDGHVIPDNVAQEIFVPFFTTKKTGSGIGLSLSRQILLMQGLSLALNKKSIYGYNVTFEIECAI